MQSWMRAPARTLLLGAAVGTVILGVGGRLAMAAIQLQTTGDSDWSLGGSITVVFLGAVSGLAGAAMALASDWFTARVRAPNATRYVLLAAMLTLVTMRGLRGTPEIGAWYFYPLVATYGVLFVIARRQSQRA